MPSTLGAGHNNKSTHTQTHTHTITYTHITGFALEFQCRHALTGEHVSALTGDLTDLQGHLQGEGRLPVVLLPIPDLI